MPVLEEVRPVGIEVEVVRAMVGFFVGEVYSDSREGGLICVKSCTRCWRLSKGGTNTVYTFQAVSRWNTL